MQRGTRYSDIVSEQTLSQQHAVIIGCGAIGRQLGTMIASMGFRSASLIDFDIVEEVNLGTQGWEENQIGSYKVDALYNTMTRLHSKMEINSYVEKFSIETYRKILLKNPTIIFIAIDSLSKRYEFYKTIFLRIKTHFVPIIDGRMSAEVLRIVSSLCYADLQYSMFTAEGIQLEEPCTRRSTYYCAATAASFMINNYMKYVRGISVRKDLQYYFQTYCSIDSNQYEQFYEKTSK